MSETLSEATKVLDAARLMAISTVTTEGLPEAAVIGFAYTPALEIVFLTHSSSRKYANLMHNPHVALVLGWDDNQTIQYEGTAHELSGAELETAKETYVAQNTGAEKRVSAPGIAMFKVDPTWARYTSINSWPWVVEEVPLP